MSELGTYQGASTIMRKTLVWNRSRISMLADNYFLSSSCRAPFLTRGRVCNLQCNHSLVKVTQAGPIIYSMNWVVQPKVKVKVTLVYGEFLMLPLGGLYAKHAV
jgi:hypothetical protein